MGNHSTANVAKTLGIDKSTLLRWLRNGKVPEPRRLTNGGIDARIWSDRDVERARKYKLKNYRKGRGRKPKPKK